MNLARRHFIRTSLLALGGLVLLPDQMLLAATGAGTRIHLVKKGETLSGIAERYGVSTNSIQAANRLKSSRIVVNQRLVIPAAAEAPAASRPSVSPGAMAALAPVIEVGRDLRITPGRWTHLVVHHSGIEAGNAKSYDGAHRRRGMENGLAYHFVIGNGRDSGDGQIEIGPRWRKQIYGGHVRSQAMNECGIGICLVGNFELRKPGARQLESLHALLAHLRGDGLPGSTPAKVTVHRRVDRNHTVCPGKRFPYAELKRRYGAVI